MQPQSTTPNCVCLQCGTPFHGEPRAIAIGRSKYCSPACYHQYRKGKPIKNRIKPAGSPLEQVPCACGCGQFFTPKKCHGRPGYTRYILGHSRRGIPNTHWRSIRTPLIDRFWKKVEKTASCWLWKGAPLRSGHGVINSGGSEGRSIGAHRVSWELHNGPIPEGMCVLHNCPGGDNPACVNPAHLFLGTSVDNAKDMFAKGRQADPHYRQSGRERWALAHPGALAGANGSGVKLTAEQVAIIRTRNGEPSRNVARDYGVTHDTILRIWQGKTWREALQ